MRLSKKSCFVIPNLFRNLNIFENQIFIEAETSSA
jgi:hypothetical protein